MLLYEQLLASLALLSLPATALPQTSDSSEVKELSRVVIFTPPSDYKDPRVLYARTAQLPNDELLATWENYSPEPPAVYFPVYKSTDKGATWTELSRVEDQGYGYGLRYQPELYVLPEDFAGFKAGTVLLAGSSIPTDLSSTQLDLYASEDSGQTWKFLSHVAAGGEAQPNNGVTPVWEPFLLLHNGKLIYYYSDQRDPAHGQKLVHQTSSDLLTWGPVVDDVAYPTYSQRPGMPTLALLPNGEYIYLYEYGGGPNPANSGTFPVYYRLSSDPEAIGAAAHHLLRTTDGTVPTGSPYVVWSSAGGVNGTIVVSSGCCSDIYVNTALGAEGAWRKVASPEAASYTRSLRVFQEDPSSLLIAGGGRLPPSTTNKVTISVMKVPA
ncbi:glycoside hydrolase family 93 protein [Hypoxylon fragiforme]|uniref:glycoside hydrolase family 93 protein n=1 Tax=Hypoxylon fragiforme TaxID=63214 RepID=UPI0020C702AF|nr:glycoside hydrolase family 93 protein [Hypoxylon fragiforme]KAI2611637.1 glycoside hydrolase family 93 protein [Hypoxylon fragiforme]